MTGAEAPLARDHLISSKPTDPAQESQIETICQLDPAFLDPRGPYSDGLRRWAAIALHGVVPGFIGPARPTRRDQSRRAHASAL